MKRVALVAVFNEAGKLLLGKRRDNGKWTLVAGGVNPGEAPEKGALREMWEECGLKPAEFYHIGERETKTGLQLYLYRAVVKDPHPTCEHDPDEECLFWRWVDVKAGVPKDIAEDLAGPKDPHDNALISLYGLQKSERYYEPGVEDLAKAESAGRYITRGELAKYGQKPTLILVRHGATDFNSGTGAEPTERLRGWLNVPLNDQGRQEAEHAGALIGDHPVARIVASDLDRTVETARAVARHTNNPPLTVAPQLRPWHLGEMHGQPLAHVLPEMLYYLEHEDKCPPGGEPFAAFHKRALGFLMRLMEEAKANPGAGAVVAVSHSREARLLKAWVQGGCRPDGAIDKGPILDKAEAAKTGHLLVLQWTGSSWELGDEKVLGHHEGEDKVPAELSKKEFEHAPDHHFAQEVPEGGSSCAKCSWLSDDGAHCPNEYFVKYNGGSKKLPVAAERYCCDEFTQKDVAKLKKAGERFEHLDLDPPAQGAEPARPDPVQQRAKLIETKNPKPKAGKPRPDPLQERAAQLEVGETSGPSPEIAVHGHRTAQAAEEAAAWWENEAKLDPQKAHVNLQYAANLRARAKELPRAPGPERASLLEVGDKVAPPPAEQTPPKLLSVGGEETHGNLTRQGHNRYDYSHHLPEAFRQDGRRLVVRHTPGQYDNYAYAAYERPGLPEQPIAWAYPSSVPTANHDVQANEHVVAAAKAALAQHQGLIRENSPLLHPQPEPKKPEFGSRWEALELMEKAEADEVDRLLLHPDPLERRMALKLKNVNESHLTRAFNDEDEEVQRLALAHPSLAHHGLLALMQHPNRTHLQLLGLQHPALERAHIEALYHTHKDKPFQEKKDVLHAVSHHPHLDGPLIEQMVGDGNGAAVVENLNTPAHVVHKLIEDHFLNPKDDATRALARRALKHPHAPAHLVERAFKEGPLDVKIAVAQSQHLPEALAQDALMRGQLPAGDNEALLRSFVVANPKATKRHLETAAQDRNPIVRHAARTKLGGPALKKFDVAYGRFLTEQLAKTVRPEDYRGITRALDPAGPRLVDHKPDLEAHPPGQAPLVQAYKQAVLEHPAPVKRTSAGDSGITKKLVYKLGPMHPTHAGAAFMVKPYHERVPRRVQTWGKHPHQGWAEMTNQALYHAAGMGHLHQRVHVAEHAMGPDRPAEPALVVHMEPGWETVMDHQGAHKTAEPQVKQDARKVAVMDFLSNNLDRHHGNLMVKQDPTRTQPVTSPHNDLVFQHHPYTGLLAIDHSRSFQYQNTHMNKWRARKTQPREMYDRFGDYVSKSGVNDVDPLLNYDVKAQSTNPAYEPTRQDHSQAQEYDLLERYKPVFDWWETVAPKVKEAFHKRLAQIKDPGTRDHLKRNFDARAAWLDERANFGLENYGTDWYRDENVPVYRPGELTEDEKEMRRHDMGPLFQGA